MILFSFLRGVGQLGAKRDVLFNPLTQPFSHAIYWHIRRHLKEQESIENDGYWRKRLTV